MNKSASAIAIIGVANGPTSACLIKRNSKLTLRQKLGKFKYNIKRTCVEKTLQAGGHTMDEMLAYIVNVHGFVELGSDEIEEEYNEMRASFLLQHAPELLGEYAALPKLKSESQEDLQDYIAQAQERVQKAKEIPCTEFDIDFHKLQISFGNRNDNIYILVEKRFGYIGGGASGSKRVMKKFQRIYKDIYRYYGVTEEDIKKKSKRYEEVVRALSR